MYAMICQRSCSGKCDVWSYPAKLFDAEDLAEFAFARGSYIDLLSADAATFASFEACEQQLRAWTQISRSIELPACRAEWTLRPARIFSASGELASLQDSVRRGFATTLYCWGYGDSPQLAADAWATGLLALIEPVSTFSRS